MWMGIRQVGPCQWYIENNKLLRKVYFEKIINHLNGPKTCRLMPLI